MKKHKEMEDQKKEMFEKDKDERLAAARAEAAANAGIPGVSVIGEEARGGAADAEEAQGGAVAAAAAGGASATLAAMDGEVVRRPLDAGTLNEDVTVSHRAEQEAARAREEEAED